MDERTGLSFCRECGYNHGGAKWCPQCGAPQQEGVQVSASSGVLDRQTDHDAADADAMLTVLDEHTEAENDHSAVVPAQPLTVGYQLKRIGKAFVLLIVVAMLAQSAEQCSTTTSSTDPSDQASSAVANPELRTYLEEALVKHNEYNEAALTFTSYMSEMNMDRAADKESMDQAIRHAQNVEDKSHDLSYISSVPDEAKVLDGIFVEMSEHATEVKSAVQAWSRNPYDATAINDVAYEARGFKIYGCRAAAEYQRLGEMVDMDTSAMQNYSESDCQ